MSKNSSQPAPVKSPAASSASVLHPIAKPQKDLVSVTTSREFSGPIPPPELLHRYDEVVPGAANRILEMAEREAAHRQQVELAVAQANIATQAEVVSINRRKVENQFSSDRLGQLLGGAISFTALIGAIYLAVNGHSGAAAVVGALPLASVVRALTLRGSKDPSEFGDKDAKTVKQEKPPTK